MTKEDECSFPLFYGQEIFISVFELIAVFKHCSGHVNFTIWKRYHTVGTGPKSNRKIPHCRNRSKVQ